MAWEARKKARLAAEARLGPAGWHVGMSLAGHVIAFPPHRLCSFPLGDPARNGFRFCGEAIVPDKPYCAAHCAIAYKATPDAE